MWNISTNFLLEINTKKIFKIYCYLFKDNSNLLHDNIYNIFSCKIVMFFKKILRRVALFYILKFSVGSDLIEKLKSWFGSNISTKSFSHRYVGEKGMSVSIAFSDNYE